MQARRVSDSQTTLTLWVGPADANTLGHVHGGVAMRLIDEAGAIAATRHARRAVVTVAVDSLTFLSPVHIGELMTVCARLTYVGRTSMEAEVTVEAEEVASGRRTVTNRAYLVYVATGDDDRPVAVPPLLPETEEERQRWEAGRIRQEERRARRSRS